MKLKIKIIVLSIIVLSFGCSCNCFATDDFTHTLELAKYSACKDVIKHIQQSINPQIHQSKLKALSSGPFPWRFEITNGYQEGFVYYALLGYANELSGDIPFAYRCYQNSLACIDEDKSFSHPLPRAEIYLAIGRTCLAAGRYMDAKDWLDNASLESGDNKNLQAAIDRVLIQRANELGDYPEIIFLYQHLLSIANDNNNPPLKVSDPANAGGETGGCKLTKEDYANYSQILFYSRKDREGFSKLLAGISKLGIDNNLGVKDPLVDKFLNNIMRADDDEVKWFYDLLGWAIVDARAKAGDENYLAFLCNARTLFCKVYPFLKKENDIDKIKKRIAQQISKNESSKEYNYQKKKKKRGNNVKRVPGKTDDILTLSLQESIEDILMTADIAMQKYNISVAQSLYQKAMNVLISNDVNGVYDGLTYQENAVLGMAGCTKKLDVKILKSESIRSCNIAIRIWDSITNSAIKSIVDEYIQENIQFSSERNKQRYYLKKINNYVQSDMIEEAFALYNEILESRPYNECYLTIGMLYAARGDTQKAFNVLMNGIKYSYYNNQRRKCLKQARETWSWASDADLNEFRKIYPAAALINKNGFPILGEALDWRNIWYVNEKKIRNYINNNKCKKALDIMSERNNQPEHYLYRAIAYRSLNDYVNATNSVLNSYKKTKAITKTGLGADLMPSDNVYIRTFFNNTTK